MKVLRKQRHKMGFTFVEILVGVTLSTVIAGTIFNVYIGQQRNFIVSNSYITIHKEARMAMDWLAKDIRWNIALASTHGSYTTSDSCIILEVPSIDSAGDVIDFQNDHDFIIYKLNDSDSTKLDRVVDAKDGVSSRTDETRTVAENIGTLAFSYSGTGLSSIGDLSIVTYVNISLAANKSVIGIDLSDNLTTEVKFRNRG